jgi:hypothetical protein
MIGYDLHGVDLVGVGGAGVEEGVYDLGQVELVRLVDILRSSSLQKYFRMSTS